MKILIDVNLYFLTVAIFNDENDATFYEIKLQNNNYLKSVKQVLASYKNNQIYLCSNNEAITNELKKELNAFYFILIENHHKDWKIDYHKFNSTLDIDIKLKNEALSKFSDSFILIDFKEVLTISIVNNYQYMGNILIPYYNENSNIKVSLIDIDNLNFIGSDLFESNLSYQVFGINFILNEYIKKIQNEFNKDFLVVTTGNSYTKTLNKLNFKHNFIDKLIFYGFLNSI